MENPSGTTTRRAAFSQRPSDETATSADRDKAAFGNGAVALESAR